MQRRISALLAICAIATSGLTLHVLSSRALRPDWLPVRVEDFALSIPHSPAYDGLAPYDMQSDGDEPGIRFGALVSAGTFSVREYYLSREARSDLLLLAQLRSGECGQAALRSIGSVTGVAYMVGGAKGCSRAFAFNQGRHTYVLRRFAGLGASPVVFGMAEARIIDSLQEL